MFNLPNYLKELPDNAMIGSLDICKIFNLNTTSITNHIRLSKVPPPTMKVLRAGKSAYKWNLGEVKKYIKARNCEKTPR